MPVRTRPRWVEVQELWQQRTPARPPHHLPLTARAGREMEPVYVVLFLPRWNSHRCGRGRETGTHNSNTGRRRLRTSFYLGTKLEAGTMTKVDLNSPTANMYGCEPCPNCQSIYRFPSGSVYVKGKWVRLEKTKVVCDNCGLAEDICPE